MFKNSLFFNILKIKKVNIENENSTEMLNEIYVFLGDSDLYMENTAIIAKRVMRKDDDTQRTQLFRKVINNDLL